MYIVHNFLENRKKTKNNFFIYLIHLISKLESVDFWEFGQRRRGNLLNGSHDWCLVIPQMK